MEASAESPKEEIISATRDRDRDRELDSRAGVIRFLIDCTRVARKFGGPQRRCEAEAWRTRFEARLQELERPTAAVKTEVGV